MFVIAGLLWVANFVPVKREARTSADDTSDRTLDGRDIVTRQVRANDFAYIVWFCRYVDSVCVNERIYENVGDIFL